MSSKVQWQPINPVAEVAERQSVSIEVCLTNGERHTLDVTGWEIGGYFVAYDTEGVLFCCPPSSILYVKAIQK